MCAYPWGSATGKGWQRKKSVQAVHRYRKEGLGRVTGAGSLAGKEKPEANLRGLAWPGDES